MSIKILKNHLLVKIDKRSKTEAGLYMTEESAIAAAREATYGEVVEVGPSASIKKGEFVLYKQYVGNELKHSTLDENFHYIVVSEDDILAVVPEEKKSNGIAK